LSLYKKNDNKNIKKLLTYLLNLSDESKENINCLCENEQNIFTKIKFNIWW